jgi:hypothetical protein
MATINKYRVYCVTDTKYEEIWMEEEPTTCPIDTAHSIDGSLTTIVEIREPNLIEIKEEFVKTQGYYQSLGYEAEIDGNIDSTTTMTHSWPIQISILDGWFYSDNTNVGDKVSVTVAKDMVTGGIIAPVSVDDKTITVQSTVIDNTGIGYYLKLTDGVNMTDLGRVLSINAGNSTVNVENGSSFAFSHASPTYVQQTIRIITDMFINVPNCRFAFAEKKHGAKNLPPNIPLHITYTNRTGGAKKFYYNIEHIY